MSDQAAVAAEWLKAARRAGICPDLHEHGLTFHNQDDTGHGAAALLQLLDEVPDLRAAVHVAIAQEAVEHPSGSVDPSSDGDAVRRALTELELHEATEKVEHLEQELSELENDPKPL
jgi:hypothetical protein